MKKIIGVGILAFVIFAITIVTVKVDIAPTVTKTFDQDAYTLKTTIANLSEFNRWDPKKIQRSDLTEHRVVNKNTGNIDLVFKDSLNNIIARYLIQKSTLDTVILEVQLDKLDPIEYVFAINPAVAGSNVTWSMNFEGNLMMSMFDVEQQLEENFIAGFKNLEAILK